MGDKIDLEYFFNESPYLFCVFDLTGKLIKINQNSQSILGYSPEEILYKNIKNFIFNEDFDKTLKEIRKITQNDLNIKNFKNRFIHKNGHLIILNWSANKNNGLVYATAKEITKNNINVKSLNLTNELTKAGNWSFNFKTKESFCSEKLKSILNKSESIKSLNDFKDSITHWDNLFQKILQAYLNCSDFDFCFEYQVSENNYRFFRTVGKIEPDISGNPYQAYGTVIDIHDEMTLSIKNQTDLIELTNTKNILEKNESELNALISSLDQIIIELDYNCNFKKIMTNNPDLLYKPSSQMIDKNIAEVFPENISSIFMAKINEVKEKDQIQEVEYQLPGFDSIWFKAKICPIKSEERTKGFLILVADITTHKFNEINSIQNAKLASLGEMAANIAHEINNPLMIISTNVSLIDSEISKLNLQISKVAFKRIQDTINRISKTIKGLKNLSQKDESKEKVLFKINDVIDDSLGLFSDRLTLNNINLDLNIQEKIFKGKPTLIGQVLINLINNSIQAMEDSPYKKITISTFQDKNNLILELSDTGPGISEEIVSKIMKPFCTTKKTGHGSGLSLSISSNIMKSHGGELILSKHKDGCSFQLIFPKENSI